MVNVTALLARSETFVEVYQTLMADLEIQMDSHIQLGDEGQEAAALLRVEINKIRALIGYWRTEVAFWRNELNENKNQIKESNKLASAT